jgi:hypothetical protein
MTEDRTESALLNFIYSLERLLTLEGETEGVTDKIANRTASMVGLDDEERMRVMRFMKSAYGARSGVVHGGRKRKTPAQIDMQMLTDVCRRALAGAILLGPRLDDEFIRTLLISRMNQAAVLRVARKIRSLTTSA